ncbi:prolipoprotein diacylglyceryl transferase [Flammeovirga yaeyamensis]|uniref:prolipoprotein diacylglyceryl transferase n=1 Tax=Flammeovirga yaeyamensis TaxID=367791 RepID=UPI00146E309F|nr:prolipoprotein diacylglyceryl transferase [Flammeovirga yaeyamensis]MBB3698519.1 prolipoprotein diacylglyceryl transferase [Flammeovirga yaeyamensis]NMF34132.1 prolipoprotein diacylglyceryl transferase [Flammeovirga yaeyamensis]
METILAFITWDVNPEIFPSISWLPVRWYGLLFSLGFLIGTYIMAKIFVRENRPESDADAILLYMVVATVIGARLGHVVFYQPDYYFTPAHFIEIFQVWKGGLASHGGAIGIIIALYYYAKKRPDQPWLWILDRIVIPVALAGCFIRFGNLMNSEIVGKPAEVAWAFIFTRLDNIPRHPAQLYESLTYLGIFFILGGIYKKQGPALPQGRLFGLFLVLVFGMRFVWEFFKENQVGFEQGMEFNMGQLLSIPAVLGGLYFIWRSTTPAAAPPPFPEKNPNLNKDKK